MSYFVCFFVTHEKDSRERGLARSGGGFGRMVRSLWRPAGKLGAQPSGTFSFRQDAGSELGAATVHSHSVAAGRLGLLTILERTQPERANPLSRRPPHHKKLPPQSLLPLLFHKLPNKFLLFLAHRLVILQLIKFFKQFQL